MRLNWLTERRKLRELVPLENNPFGKISVENKDRLRQKIRKLGIFEIPTIDINNELLTFNKRYHLLCELESLEFEIDVRVPERPLSDGERKEIIISSNIHEGEWDKQILEELYTEIDLEDIGLDIGGVDDLVGQQDDALEALGFEDGQEPEYQIVPRFSEKYDAFVIISDNEIDATHVAELLGVKNAKCYKTEHIGRTHVIRAYDFLEQLNKAKKP